MTRSDIANIRLKSQHISATPFKTVKEIVGWMGAIQAQDYMMCKWALGIRLPKLTDTLIQEALDKGEILRTHLLRPTWHLVSADDIYWMQELSAPRIKSIMQSRNKELELTEAIYLKSNNIIEKALTNGHHLTRDQLIAKLNKAGIASNDNRAAHLLMRAELDGIACGGVLKNKKQTYALLSERVKKRKSLTKDEALAKLAFIYFSSRCPASLQDFTWWSGLQVKDARHALEMIKPKLTSEIIESQTYWFPNTFSLKKETTSKVYLLPPFDEFIISYKDRNVAVELTHQKKAFSSNGVFYPTIILNGKVIGLWKRTIKKDKVTVEINLFESKNKAIHHLIEKAAKKFGDFLNTKTEVLYL